MASAVKYRWDLSIDPKEKTALSKALGSCPDNSQVTLPAKPGKPNTEKVIGLAESDSNPEVTPTATPTPTPTTTPTTGSSSLLAGLVWKIEISGPASVTYKEPFTLTLKVTDVDGQPLAGKQLSYTSWQFSGLTDPTDSNGSVDLVISDPLPSGYSLAIGTLILSVAKDYGNASKTVQVKASASPSPSADPTPSPSATDNPVSYQLITPGAFCAKADAGKYGKSSSGVIYQCKTSATENRLRWRR